jgi:hypothetical protein
MLNARAAQNPWTVNPSTQSLASKTTTALIAKRNKPKVTRVNGIVRRMSRGRMVTFNTARAKETHIAVVNAANSTPGRK